MGNRNKNAKNTSGYKGVFWAKWAKQWRAVIKFDHRSVNLGYFKTPEEAARAYDKKAKELFGEFARTNF